MSADRDELVRALKGVASGDTAAFELLYSATSLKLYGIVARILRQRELADEILQEVYLKVWQRAGDFDAEAGSPMTWLATIARNRALDEAKRKTMRSLDDSPGVLQIPGDDDPRTTLEKKETALRVEACIDRLEPERREIVRLVYYYGMTREEISQRLGRPVSTVKTWLRRSLFLIKDCLNQ
jgi:RNA polymerase sigma-70 factor (ECF subfamily)